MHCVILGDGTAQGLARVTPMCVNNSQPGISSAAFLTTRFHPLTTDLVVISLGVNDLTTTQQTRDTLIHLRAQVTALRVVWLLPAIKPAIRTVIADVAQACGDRIIDTAVFVGSDHLHPSWFGYKTIAVLSTLPIILSLESEKR